MNSKTFLHDLNNSLTVIRLSIGHLKKQLDDIGDPSTFMIKLANNISKGVSDIEGMCHELLGQESSGENYAPVSSLLRLAIQQYDHLNINIVVVEYGECQLVAYGTAFNRIFLNIIKNALEAGASEIQINLEENKITFIDNGGGIPAKILHIILQNESVTTKKEGKGLGISSIKQICNELNWKSGFYNCKNHPADGKNGLKIVLKPAGKVKL